MQRQDAQTDAVSLGSIGPAGEHSLDDLLDLAADLRRPPAEPLGVPLSEVAVRVGHVLGQGGVAVGAAVALVGNHTHILVVNGDHSLVVDHLDLGLRIAGSQVVGHAVVVTVLAQLDMVVDRHTGHLDLFQREPLRGKRSQGCPLGPLEELPAADTQPLQGAIVVFLHKIPDGPVHLIETTEAAASKGRVDPLVDQPYRVLGKSLVPCPPHPRREDHQAVVAGELLEHRVDLGLIAVGSTHSGLQVVGHQRLG